MKIGYIILIAWMMCTVVTAYFAWRLDKTALKCLVALSAGLMCCVDKVN